MLYYLNDFKYLAFGKRNVILVVVQEKSLFYFDPFHGIGHDVLTADESRPFCFPFPFSFL